MKIPGLSLSFAAVLSLLALLTGCSTSVKDSTQATPASTTTSLTSSTSTLASGASVTFTATVSPSAATGSVSFFDGATPIVSIPLVSGVATLSTAALTVGAHTITATYTGSNTYAASTASSVSVTVTTIATTTALSASASSVAPGTAVTFRALLLPLAATGTVAFFDGSAQIGTGTVANGSASFSTTSLASGAHSVTAVYGGSGTYAPSTSAAVSVVVTTPTTLLLSAPSSAPFGSSVTFTASISPAAATGTVTFFDGTTALGTGTLTAGSATFSTTSLAVGSHSISASYAGSATYTASTSPRIAETIAATATTTVLTTSTTTQTPGTPLTLTATVSPSAATGTVTFNDGTTILGTSTLSSGVATLSVPTLSSGVHTITASYSGATTYAASTSNSIAITGSGIASTTTLAASSTSAAAGTTLTFTATISPSAATGTVTFYDGSAIVGTGTVASGVATYSTAALAAGTHSISATYGGDTTYAASTSAAASVTITVATTTLTLVSNTNSAVAGISVTFTATIKPSTATGTVTFSDGATVLGTNSLSAGLATITTSSLATGVHFITATVPASASFTAATSNGVAVNVTRASTPPVTGTFFGPGLTGKVMAGSLPVLGASVQLYVAGTTGNGITAGSLLASPITTDADGGFTMPSGYSCPLPGSQAYLVATGGGTTSNASAPLEFLTALGSCSALTSTPILLNETNTAAAVWALTQFMSAGGSIGSSSTNTTGIANAFAISASLVSTSTGVSPGASYPTTTASTPAPRINAMANLLNTCAASNTACQTLFAAAGNTTDTLDAALAIVTHPARGAAALFALAKNSTAYTSVPSQTPSDWTFFTLLSGGGLNSPSSTGVMSNGNVWVANYSSGASQFTPLGAAVFPSGVSGYGQTSTYNLAVDQSDNAWIANDVYSGSVSKIAANGLSGANYTHAEMQYSKFAAIDLDGSSVWIADYGNGTLTHLSATGVALSGNGYQSSLIQFPDVVAIDASDNVWVNNASNDSITRIAPDGTNAIKASACCSGPTSIAIDQRGFVWVGNQYSNSLSEVSASGVVLATGLTGGGLNVPQGIAVDGVGNLWIANHFGVAISEFSGTQTSTPGTALSPSTGFAPDGPIAGADSMSIDAAGNLWVANFNSNNVVRYLGLAVPVKTPRIGPVQVP